MDRRACRTVALTFVRGWQKGTGRSRLRRRPRVSTGYAAFHTKNCISNGAPWITDRSLRTCRINTLPPHRAQRGHPCFVLPVPTGTPVAESQLHPVEQGLPGRRKALVDLLQADPYGIFTGGVPGSLVGKAVRIRAASKSNWSISWRSWTVLRPLSPPRIARWPSCACVHADQMAEEYPVATMDTHAPAAAGLLAEHRLPGLVIAGTDGRPRAVLPASQVVDFIVPKHVQSDSLPTGVLNESMADRIAEKPSGKQVRDVVPERLIDVPAVKADDTIVEVAAAMARVRCPLIAVMDERQLAGVITTSRLLAAALHH